MSNNNKNLEAENEIFKGIFRTPFAFLFGGPTGFIANILFTAWMADDEIKRENAHKEKLKEMGVIGDPDIFKVGREVMNNQKKLYNDVKNDQLSYLKKEFNECEDPSFADCFNIRFHKKATEALHKERHYAASITYGDNYIDNTCGASYLPENEFIEKYKRDRLNGNIIKKYKFYNNNQRITFGYMIKCKDGINRIIFTGLFTQI